MAFSDGGSERSFQCYCVFLDYTKQGAVSNASRGGDAPDGFVPDAIAASGIAVLPSLRIGVTSTDSHLIGAYSIINSVIDSRTTFAAAKIFSTDSDISGPIPSPGINVTG